jgi:hypothetical protein
LDKLAREEERRARAEAYKLRARARDRLRRQRAREVAAMTLTTRQLERETVIDLDPEPLPPRPKTRGECANGPRPCPWVSCRHHLYLEAQPTGSIKFIFPDLEPEEMKESCSLDVADRGEQTIVTVAQLMNVTRVRIDQIEYKVHRKLRMLPMAREARDEAEGLRSDRDANQTWIEGAR